MGLKSLKKFKIGDTLVEVSIAIGIFSMVAIATISVINASTSSTQGILENTITREEIDAQAEALRFIQSAYVAGGNNDPSDTTSATKYARLWAKISERALSFESGSSVRPEIVDIIANYNPSTCSALYNASGSTSLIKQKAFLINTRALSSDNINDIIITPGTDKMGLFKTAETFPRVVYNQAASGAIYDQGEDSNNANNNDFTIKAAEGLFIVAVRDSDGTMIVADGNGSATKKNAYIDFYIRSCWFSPGADHPSTISTVVRLYDPDAINANKYNQKGIILNYSGGSGATGSMPSQYILAGEKVKLLENQFQKQNYVFMGWELHNQVDGTGRNLFSENSTFTAPTNLAANTVITLYARWQQFYVTLNYTGGTCSTSLTGSVASQTKYTGATFTMADNGFSCSHHRFAGWKATYNGNTEYLNPGASFTPPSSRNNYTVTVEAQWDPIYIVKYDTKSSWSIDSHECNKTNGCRLSTSEPTRSGYAFKGWCTADTTNENCAGTVYQPGANLPGSALTSLDTTLHAMWLARNEKITIVLRWSSSPSDLDSHVEGQKSNGTNFHAYYSSKVGSDVDGTVIAQLDQDITSGYGPETFTINTLGGKNYYYYVYCYSSCSRITGATVTVSGPYLGTRTFNSNDASGSGRYWNVFAYKDGQIIVRQTQTSSPETSY